MHVELRHLRYFVAVAEELNFSRAAERLHIAQPALSAQIRSLEAQVGSELFSRTTRTVSLTSSGEMLLADAREILGRVDTAVAKLQAVARGERGALRIGFVAHGAGEVGMNILQDFGRRFPSIQTHLVSATSLEELQRHVRDRQTDLAFVWLPLLYDELAALPLVSERKFVALHPDHPLAAKSAVTPSDLREVPLVAPWDHAPAGIVDAWFREFRPAGRKHGDPAAMTVDESFAFASRGLAVYCVPESVLRFYSRPDVAFRPILDVAPAHAAISWRADTSNPAVAALLETARSALGVAHEGAEKIQNRDS